MKPALIKTELASYVPGEWDGQDNSELTPIGDLVVIIPDESAKMAGKKGLIHLPDDQVERQSFAAESGVILDMGPGAFRWNSDRTRPFEGRKPAIGDRVAFNRYSGSIRVSPDGQAYRLMPDSCITAIIGPKEKANG